MQMFMKYYLPTLIIILNTQTIKKKHVVINTLIRPPRQLKTWSRELSVNALLQEQCQ